MLHGEDNFEIDANSDHAARIGREGSVAA